MQGINTTFNYLPINAKFTKPNTGNTTCEKIEGGYIMGNQFYPTDDDFEVVWFRDQLQPNQTPAQTPMNGLAMNQVINVINGEKKQGGRVWRFILWTLLGLFSGFLLNIGVVILELLSGRTPFQ